LLLAVAVADPETAAAHNQLILCAAKMQVSQHQEQFHHRLQARVVLVELTVTVAALQIHTQVEVVLVGLAVVALVPQVE
jgi:hypothetical protein